MEKKYILTDEIKEFNGKILHRIQAVRDFGKIRTGDLGGWIEKEGNLSHEGDCWVCNDAQVYDNARVGANALVGDDAHVFGNAQICGNAWVYNSAWVYDSANIYGNAQIYGNACVYHSAWVYDNAHIYGNAKIYGNAQIHRNANVYGDAIICEEMLVSYSKIDTDLRTDIAASLRGQCNLLLIKNKVIAYKIVNRNLTSLFDKNFVYKIGEIAEVKNPDKSHASCASGLHFSNLTYWDDNVQKYKDKTYLVAEINVEDIITIQQGKIRCKKAKILDKVDIQ